MATIQEIKQQYPQYQDLSDRELGDKLYNKFYSDMLRADFDIKVGLKQQRTPSQELGRQLGLTARYGLEGLATVADIPGMAINALTAIGTEAGVPNLMTDMDLPSQAVSKLLTKAGVPQPEGSAERVVGDISRAVSGTGGLMKVGQRIGGKLVSLASEPLQQLSGAIGSSLGAGTTREMGGGVGAQSLAGIAGGLGAGLTTGKIQSLGKQKVTPDLIDDIATRGIDETQSSSAVQSLLRKTAKKDLKQASEAMRKAEVLGRDAFIEPNEIQGFINNMKNIVADEFDEDKIKYYNNIINNLNQKVQAGRTTVNDLQGLRRTVTSDATSGGGIGRAASVVRNEVDDFLTSENVIKGSPESIKTWRDAIGKFRDYYRKFDTPKEIAKVIDSDTTLESAENLLLGGRTPSTAKDASKIYNNVMQALPKNEKASTGFLMRQSVVNRMIKNSARSTDMAEGVSANNLANQIRNLRRENQSLWNKFPADEKFMLEKLEKDLRDTASGGWINKTGEFLVNRLRKLSGSNLELPRTIKAKTIVSIDDLIDMTNIKPVRKSNTQLGTIMGITASEKE